MVTTLTLVLGKPPTRSPVLGEVIARLRRRVAVRVHVDDGRVPAGLADADLVALRGLRTTTLHALEPLEAEGTVAFLDPPSSLLIARDRVRLHDALRGAQVPVPPARRASDWDAVRTVAAASVRGTGIVVKQRDMSVGRSAGVWIGRRADLGDTPPFAGPYVVEPELRPAGPELKLYGIGAHAAAVVPATGELRPLGSGHRRLVARVAAASGLSILGIDVVTPVAGPMVVDVNAFPSCRRLPDAATRLTGHLLDHVDR